MARRPGATGCWRSSRCCCWRHHARNGVVRLPVLRVERRTDPTWPGCRPTSGSRRPGSSAWPPRRSRTTAARRAVRRGGPGGQHQACRLLQEDAGPPGVPAPAGAMGGRGCRRWHSDEPVHGSEVPGRAVQELQRGDPTCRGGEPGKPGRRQHRRLLRPDDDPVGSRLVLRRCDVIVPLQAGAGVADHPCHRHGRGGGHPAGRSPDRLTDGSGVRRHTRSGRRNVSPDR